MPVAAQKNDDWNASNPGTKPNASPPVPPRNNPDAVDHAMIKGAGTNDSAGGRDEGLVNPPTVSLNPTSQPQGEAEAEIGEHTMIDAVSMGIYGTDNFKFNYPFENIKVGSGMFIPVEKTALLTN